MLPIVKRGGRREIVNACIKSAHLLWAATCKLRLDVNMHACALQGPDTATQQAWANYLLSVGDGRVETHPTRDGGDAIRLPGALVGPADRDGLLR